MRASGRRACEKEEGDGDLLRRAAVAAAAVVFAVAEAMLLMLLFELVVAVRV